MTCQECRWKTERGECPWNYEYNETDYAEDCIDFRYDKFPETAFMECHKTDEVRRILKYRKTNVTKISQKEN